MAELQLVGNTSQNTTKWGEWRKSDTNQKTGDKQKKVVRVVQQVKKRTEDSQEREREKELKQTAETQHPYVHRAQSEKATDNPPRQLSE